MPRLCVFCKLTQWSRLAVGRCGRAGVAAGAGKLAGSAAGEARTVLDDRRNGAIRRRKAQPTLSTTGGASLKEPSELSVVAWSCGSLRWRARLDVERMPDEVAAATGRAVGEVDARQQV